MALRSLSALPPVDLAVRERGIARCLVEGDARLDPIEDEMTQAAGSTATDAQALLDALDAEAEESESIA
ncbi:hypothetical protein DM806_00960 [Sphingobium lactosutens]|nr:hypothetical protein [Sphingobium lactosutens]